MTMTALALAFSLALASEDPAHEEAEKREREAAAAAKAVAASAAAIAREADQPPPASKSDQALWQAGRDVNTQLPAQKRTAERLGAIARRQDYARKLQELAARGALPQARADELGAKLAQRWRANRDIMERQWPVGSYRVCGQELLNFEALLDPPTGTPGELKETRKELTDCVGRANAVLRPLGKSNQEFHAILTEIDKELAPLLPKPAAAPPGAPAKPRSSAETAAGAAPGTPAGGPPAAEPAANASAAKEPAATAEGTKAPGKTSAPAKPD